MCGGLGEFFGVNPVIFRISWGILCLTAVGLVAYIVAAIMIPSDKGRTEKLPEDEIGPRNLQT